MPVTSWPNTSSILKASSVAANYILSHAHILLFYPFNNNSLIIFHMSSPKMVLHGHLVVNLITKHNNNNLCPDFMFLLYFASETGTVKDQGSWGGDNGDKEISYLLQLIMMSSGLMRRFSMPIFGWSPRPRKRPGGSMRKFPILSLWLSMMQKPYSWRSRSFSSLIFYKMYEDILRNPRDLEVGRVHLTAAGIPVSPL